MNFLSILTHLPTLIPALSDILLLSSIKILSSAKDSTSYHLFSVLLNSLIVGSVLNDVPFNVIIDSIDKTLSSGNITSKNGLISFCVIIF